MTTETRSPQPRTAAVSGDPWWRRAGRTLRNVFTTDPFPELYERALAGCQAPVTTGRRLGVCSPVGGAGTSTVAALLGHQFSLSRAEKIIAVDLAATASGLQRRLLNETAAFDRTAAGLTQISQVSHERGADTNATFNTHGHHISEHYSLIGWGTSLETLGDQFAIQDNFQVLSELSAVSVFDVAALNTVIDSIGAGLHAVVVPIPMYPAAVPVCEEFCANVRTSFPNLPILPLLIDSFNACAKNRRTATSLAQQSSLKDYLPNNRRRILPKFDFDPHLAPGTNIDLTMIGEERRLQLANLAGTVLALSKGVRS